MELTLTQIYIGGFTLALCLFTWISYSRGVKVGYAKREQEWKEYNARQRDRQREREEYFNWKPKHGAKNY
jgi:hypothetical protein